MKSREGDLPHVGKVSDEASWQGKGHKSTGRDRMCPYSHLTVSTPPANNSVTLALMSSKSSLLFSRRR